MPDLEYFRPRDLQEASDFLAQKAGQCSLLAGGTDVMIDLRSGWLKARYLVDITGISQIKGIYMTGQGLYIGAGVTLSQIYSSDLITRYAPCLQRCATSFASRQIRNVATIGGNVAHASPCADTLPPLALHSTQVEIFGPHGSRTVPVEDIATGPYSNCLYAGEIIAGFVLEPWEPDFFDFQKIGRRKELSIARVSLAVMAQVDPGGTITSMRCALGSCTPTAGRFKEVEELFEGKRAEEKLLYQGARLLAERMIAVTGIRSSTIYKEKAVQGLFLRMCYPMVNYDARV